MSMACIFYDRFDEALNEAGLDPQELVEKGTYEELFEEWFEDELCLLKEIHDKS